LLKYKNISNFGFFSPSSFFSRPHMTQLILNRFDFIESGINLFIFNFFSILFGSQHNKIFIFKFFFIGASTAFLLRPSISFLFGLILPFFELLFSQLGFCFFEICYHPLGNETMRIRIIGVGNRRHGFGLFTFF
jgi:hypothetical protein